MIYENRLTKWHWYFHTFRQLWYTHFFDKLLQEIMAAYRKGNLRQWLETNRFSLLQAFLLLTFCISQPAPSWFSTFSSSALTSRIWMSNLLPYDSKLTIHINSFIHGRKQIQHPMRPNAYRVVKTTWQPKGKRRVC